MGNQESEQVLYVTWEQFSKIKDLEYECCAPYYDKYFDSSKWIAGLKEICGTCIIEKLDKYKITNVIAQN